MVSYLTVAVAVMLGVAGFHYLVHRSLAPQRVIASRTPGDVGLDYREVHIGTENGLTLFGWFVPAAGTVPAPAVVLVHGWGGNAATLLPLAVPLWQAGFALVLYDARCHGRSGEDSFASMPRFAEDLVHVVDWLRQQTAVDPRRIAIIGHSVGAGAALLAASRRHDIAAVVSIAAFAHPEKVMRRLLTTKLIPYWPFGWYILHYVQHVIGHRFDDIAPLATIHQVRCPTLLVHGAQDTTVPVAEAYAIYAARGEAPVRLRIVSGSHEDYGDTTQEVMLLVNFLREHLVPSSEKSMGAVP